jgi:glucokinase
MADSNNEPQHLVGVDLGGTKILAGVFDSQLECLGRVKHSTKAERGADAVVKRIARCVKDAVDECDLDIGRIRGVGIGAPGAVDPQQGTVIIAPNLGWENLPLKSALEKELRLPVFIENDCNICTLGVYEKELHSKPRNLVGIFIGTGIGAGLVLEGKLYSGFNRTAGEIGHMVLEVGGPQCGCGNRGCFEAFASRSAIFRRIQTGLKEGQKTILTKMLGENLTDLRSGDLRKAIRRGDKFVERIVEEAAEYAGVAVGNVINLFNPDMIVLGGGVIDQLEGEMMAIIIATALDYALPGTARGIEIMATRLGDDAGITGGAVLARRETKCTTIVNGDH